MTIFDRERRTTRRLLVAGALATVIVLVGAAFMISRVPSAQPTAATAAPEPVALGQAAPAPNAWAALTPVEQGTLQPLQGQWATLDAASKAHWIQVADRLHGRPSRAVARAAQHMAAWQKLSPAEQAQARLHYKLASRLSPAERERRWATYRASVHAAREGRDESRRALTVASPSTSIVGPGMTTSLVTEVHAGVSPSLHVNAVQTNAPASSATTGDAS
jgi:hypothetical protein